ncbi:MAG: phosphatase PAP2 family protein [Allorhizobium sp.]
MRKHATEPPHLRDILPAATPAVLRDALSRRSVVRALALFALWWLLLLAFYAFPEIDIAVARAFFVATACPEPHTAGQVCGSFPYAQEDIFIFLRKVFFYVPSAAALVLLWILIQCLQHHGATYDAVKVRRISLSLLALFIGPYVLVNLVLKGFSGRPRPYQTDLFGGNLPFTPAGSFTGQCDNNCSFVSGEAAGAGWVACIILFLPPHLRPVLAPPILAVSLVTPALRLSFGGHYLSDVTLGWLSSLVVYAAVFAVFEIARTRKIQR